MSTNIQPANSSGFNDIPAALGSNAVALLALRQNAWALLQVLQREHDFGAEQYSGQRSELVDGLEKIIDTAPAVANVLSQALNVWNTIGAEDHLAQHLKSSDFMLRDDKDIPPLSATPVQALLHVINLTSVIDQLSNELNIPIAPEPNYRKDAIMNAKHNLVAATKRTQDAENDLTRARDQLKGQDDSSLLAAESKAQLALFAQVAAYQNVISAQLSDSVGRANNLTVRFPNFGSIRDFIKGAMTAIATGTKISGAINSVFA